MGGKIPRLFLSFNNLTPLGVDIVRLLRGYDAERGHCGVSGCSAAAAAEIIKLELL